MITEKEIENKAAKYEALTAKALDEIKLSKNKKKKEKKNAEDFLSMAKNYYNDAKYFASKGKMLTALAAFSYAHAWLDAGVRAKIFEATNGQLFTLP
ncbi:MAG: DUF357 domain-containing protein [Candidatus Diapherotrites archaeon]|nr:DUF357 domain-containing protein [Candidatus Diapherotrites archaeon]